MSPGPSGHDNKGNGQDSYRRGRHRCTSVYNPINIFSRNVNSLGICYSTRSRCRCTRCVGGLAQPAALFSTRSRVQTPEISETEETIHYSVHEFIRFLTWGTSRASRFPPGPPTAGPGLFRSGPTTRCHGNSFSFFFFFFFFLSVS